MVAPATASTWPAAKGAANTTCESAVAVQRLALSRLSVALRIAPCSCEPSRLTVSARSLSTLMTLPCSDESRIAACTPCTVLPLTEVAFESSLFSASSRSPFFEATFACSIVMSALALLTRMAALVVAMSPPRMDSVARSEGMPITLWIITALPRETACTPLNDMLAWPAMMPRKVATSIFESLITTVAPLSA